ncbi:hypothetical protein BC941DRAFT_409496 [Chlamydoabsidia padenii]|nr:hypothetical protein BC941DRAFT_409496 [Chlamydoabsidia padenii]
MEHIQQTTTTTSYNTDGITHTTSTISVRELDEGEVGILMAGNNSILDPSLTPHMLTPVDYDISECDLTDIDDDLMFGSSEDDELWFPSLTKAFEIQELNNSDGDEMMADILYATNVVEVDDYVPAGRKRSLRPSKSRKTTSGPTGLDLWIDNEDMDNDRNSNSVDKLDDVIPLEIVYTVLNE